VEVAERGGFEPADLVAVAGVAAGAVPDRMVLLHDGHVVRAATGQIGPVVVLGVQSVAVTTVFSSSRPSP
jgi:hypothetical protein